MCIKCDTAKEHLNFLNFKRTMAIKEGAITNDSPIWEKDKYLEKLKGTDDLILKLQKRTQEDPELSKEVSALVFRAEEAFALHVAIIFGGIFPELLKVVEKKINELNQSHVSESYPS